VNDKFEKWLNSMYGKHGKVTATRGQLPWDGIGLSKRGELKINTTKYVENMLSNFPVKLRKKDVVKTPAGDNLFNLGTRAKLDTKRSEIFHTFVAKGLFLCKRARPNIQHAILVLCMRVRDQNQADWEKLMRVMKYLNGTKGENLTLSADDLRVVKWYVDASFALHPDFKSHTSAMMILGKKAMQSIKRKQKMNVQSSTEGKLVAATMILWMKLILEAQGYDVEKNIVYQVNKSAILLETNCKKSSGKQTRALSIRYFFITNQVEKGNAHGRRFFYKAFARQEVPKILEQYPWTLTRHTGIHAGHSVTSHETERTFEEKKILSSNERRKKRSCQHCWS
jgi:hypothetical protein